MSAQTAGQSDEQGIAQYTSLVSSARTSLEHADDTTLRGAAQSMNQGVPTDPMTLLRVSAACRRAGVDVVQP
jgi:hypothetical protein